MKKNLSIKYIYKKLHHSCLDVLTGDQQAHTELKWKHIHPIICCMAVSLLIQRKHCSKSLIEDCGGSSHTPLDRGLVV